MTYRTMPLSPPKPPPRKWPYVVTVALFAFAAPSAGFMMLVDFGAHVDGPGVGYGAHHGAGAFLFGASLISLVACVLLATRWPWARWRAIAIGAALAIAFVLSGAPTKMLFHSWKRACDLGSADGCYAYAETLPERDPARKPLLRSACRGDRWEVCDRLLDGDPEDKQAACDLLLTCKTCIHNLCGVPRSLCDKVVTRCDAPPAPSQGARQIE